MVGWPRIIEGSEQIVKSYDDDEHTNEDTGKYEEDEELMTCLVTFHIEKLQYELEHELAPGFQLMIIGIVVETLLEPVTFRYIDEGVLAVTSDNDELAALLPEEQEQPSTT
jgi:hypothetical protein